MRGGKRKTRKVQQKVDLPARPPSKVEKRKQVNFPALGGSPEGGITSVRGIANIIEVIEPHPIRGALRRASNNETLEKGEENRLLKKHLQSKGEIGRKKEGRPRLGLVFWLVFFFLFFFFFFVGCVFPPPPPPNPPPQTPPRPPETPPTPPHPPPPPNPHPPHTHKPPPPPPPNMK